MISKTLQVQRIYSIMKKYMENQFGWKHLHLALICFPLRNNQQINQPWKLNYWLNILTFFYPFVCPVDKPLWQKTFEGWKMVCLWTCQRILGTSNTIIYPVIYTEQRLVCFQLVYTRLIMSLEMHNWNALDINTMASWQKDKWRGKKKENAKEEEKKTS